MQCLNEINLPLWFCTRTNNASFVSGTSVSSPGLSLESVIHSEGDHVYQHWSEEMLSEFPQCDRKEKISPEV